MNKFSLPAISFLCIVGMLGFSAPSAHAQCTPNAAFTTPGFYPDPLPNPTAGVAYSQVIDFKLPSTFDTLGFSATVDTIIFDSISNLPPGLTYQCNQPGCKYLGGANGCMLLQGTPTITSGGPYTTTIYGTGYITLLGATFPVQQTQSINLFVNWPLNTSAELSTVSKWLVNTNDFNEASIRATINAKYDLSIYTLNGVFVASSNHQMKAGETGSIVSLSSELTRNNALIYTLSTNGSLVESRILVRK